MKIVLGADHAGFEMKKSLAYTLGDLGHEIVDVGASELDEKDDYPDYMEKMVEEILAVPPPSGGTTAGVMGVFCAGSGEGEGIAANRHKGIRAVVYYGNNRQIVKLSREHNNANVLCLGSRFLSLDEAKEALAIWLGTPFSNDERHVRRLAKIDA
jgi:ribose 5-phosphate isomerase B